jgi:large subunit ribosomal protein L29
MKSTRFRDMSEDELRREETEIVEQLFKLRFQFAVGRAEQPQKIRSARRDLARVKTRLRLLELQRAEAGKTGE